jgi:metal-responsive CopG/Arc/MetJ family transcriptional regulator
VDPYHFIVQFDEDDRRLLDQSSKLEKLSRSEILRRALRDYHRKLSQLSIAS